MITDSGRARVGHDRLPSQDAAYEGQSVAWFDDLLVTNAVETPCLRTVTVVESSARVRKRPTRS
jgi:hypothetical protein